MSTIDPHKLHRGLGTHKWQKPQPFGEDGWLFMAKNRADGIVIATASKAPGEAEDGTDGTGIEWFHASMSRPAGVPSYGDLATLHKAVWGDGYAYQVFAPSDSHVNIHERALHLWGRADGAIALPDFGMYGTI